MAQPAINIISCFEDLILLRGTCNDESSKSGYYANDIDITKDFIDQIITKEYRDAKDFHDRKLAFAIKQVCDAVITAMQTSFRTPTLVDNYRAGQYQDNLTLVAGDGYLKGINLDLWNCESFLDVFVSEIALQITTTGTVDVKVYDLIQSKLLDTIPVAVVANEISRVYPHKIYKAGKQKLNLLFAYDSTGHSANTTYINSGCATCNGTKPVKNQYERISAVKIDPGASKINSNLIATAETGGLSIVHSLSCNHESWLCSFSNLLALPILYKYGQLAMEFALNVSPNDRINTTTAINVDELTQRRNFYATWYNQSFGDKMKNIKTPSDRQCFTCKETVRHTISIG